VGSTIRIHPAEDPAAIEPGSVITFRALGNGTVITHRIVQRVDEPGLGQIHYQTKGDANAGPDPDLVPAFNVIGVSDGVIPAWQSFAVALQTPAGRLVAYGGLFVVIALGEIGEIVSAARRKDAS
jgi:signal peptidase